MVPGYLRSVKNPRSRGERVGRGPDIKYLLTDVKQFENKQFT
jgi:hypothetical protein